MNQPILVGILNDGERADNQATGGVYKQMQADMELAIADRIVAGRIDRPVEFVHQHGAGLPGGTAHNVETAVAALVEPACCSSSGRERATAPSSPPRSPTSTRRR